MYDARSRRRAVAFEHPRLDAATLPTRDVDLIISDGVVSVFWSCASGRSPRRKRGRPDEEVIGLAWKIHERPVTSPTSAPRGRRGEFWHSNMSTVRPLAPLTTWWRRDALDASGERGLDDDTAPLVGRERGGTEEARSWRRPPGRSAATSRARRTWPASARRCDGPSARPTRRA